jgi:hypothetical protein
LAEQLTWPGAGAWARALPGLVASTAFVLVFVAVAALARHPELAAVSRSFRRRTA